MIGSAWGASIDALFLALPAIFCASATLIERHEIRRKKGHKRRAPWPGSCTPQRNGRPPVTATVAPET
jgi:hypothetical protein